MAALDTAALTLNPPFIHKMPKWFLVVLTLVSFQLGAVVSKPAIVEVGALHVSYIRTAIAAIVLLILFKPSLRLTAHERNLIVLCGILIVTNSYLILAAIETIPIGVAVAIQFWGPIAIALSHSRRLLDLLWIGFGVTGILMFTPVADASFDGRGVILAAVAGGGFALFIVASARLGKSVPPIHAATLALVVGSIIMTPMSFGTGLVNDVSPSVLIRLTIVALLTGIIGFTLEFTAMAVIKTSLYAILLCLEPAIGAILGFAILDERLAWLSVAGIAAVSLAALGASVTHQRAET